MSIVSHDPRAHRFVIEAQGSVAQLDYTLSGGVMSITHTRVAPAIRGRGVAAQLMHAALRAARDAGWSVDPVCSYAAAYMARHTPALNEPTSAAGAASAEASVTVVRCE
ncbi:MAG: hypothetical protein NVS9B2_02480 [Steroidobacteraceae bacterium]